MVMSHDKTFSRSERALLGLGIALPTLVLACVAWDHKINDVPPPILPAQAMPAVNAHETLHKAFARRVVSLGTKETPDFVTCEPSTKKDAVPQPIESRKKLLAANQKTLQGVETALKQPYKQFITFEMAQLFPEYAEDRSLARLLSFAATTHADAGELPKAADSALDAMELGVKVGGDGPLIAALVGYACEAIGRKPLWTMLDRLDAPTARAAANRLSQLRAERRPVERVLDVERVWAWKTIYDLARKPGSAGSLIYGSEENGVDTIHNRWTGVQLAMANKPAALDANRRYYDRIEERLKQPYSRAPFPEIPGDSINKMILFEPSSTAFNDALVRAENNLLEVSLALQAYKLEKGAYPADFKSLLAGEISEFPSHRSVRAGKISALPHRRQRMHPVERRAGRYRRRRKADDSPE